MLTTASEPDGTDVVALGDAGPDAAPLVLLRGEIDFANAAAAERRLAELTAGAAEIVVDLSAVRYLDSSGLNLLLRQARAARARGGDLVVVHPEDGLPLFRLEAVARALTVVPTRAAAASALAARGSPGSAPAPRA